MQEMWVPSLGRVDPLEKEMATHFSILAWEIPWTEEPGRLLFMVTKPLERSFLVAQTVKNLPAMKETWVLSLCQVDPLEKEMATHSSILAWRIP